MASVPEKIAPLSDGIVRYSDALKHSDDPLNAFLEFLVGDKDGAIPRLQHLLQIPYNNCLTPALLGLNPQWDPLRGDPRFKKLCEEKKP